MRQGWQGMMLVLVTWVLLALAGCASTTGLQHSPVAMSLTVVNNVSRDVMVYLVNSDQSISSRMLHCDMHSVCIHQLNVRQITQVRYEGWMQLGIRHLGDNTRGPNRFGRIQAYEGMAVELVIKGSVRRRASVTDRLFGRRHDSTFEERDCGPHRVKDVRLRTGRYRVVCQVCGAEWDEGGFYPTMVCGI